MTHVKLESSTFNNNVEIQIGVRGWVIVGDHDFRGVHTCAFKVNSVSIPFDITNPELKLTPGRLSIAGNWATKDGRKWMENQAWIGWSLSSKIVYDFLPKQVKDLAFKTLIDTIGLNLEQISSNLTSLKVNRDFISKGYVDVTSTPSEDDESLPFLPSITKTQPSPYVGQDVSKWKVAREEMKWDPSKDTSTADASSEV